MASYATNVSAAMLKGHDFVHLYIWHYIGNKCILSVFLKHDISFIYSI